MTYNKMYVCTQEAKRLSVGKRRHWLLLCLSLFQGTANVTQEGRCALQL